MRDERIGNDINIAWGIKSGDSPFPLEGKNVTLYLHHPYGKQKVEGFRLEGNKVIWTFKGADQKYVGKHGLTLVVNEGANGMITTDSCDFVNLVACSCQVGGEDNDGVQTEAIELTSTLGFIAYDDTEIREKLSRLETDKADKTELTELSEEVGKKSEVSLEALANGNLKVTIDGVSKDFMPATPSGNPMHYMFEAVGATYNATDADIPMVGIYGDSYVHKAKHWHLNELGDISSEEMEQIYLMGRYSTQNNYNADMFKKLKQRTMISFSKIATSGHSETLAYQGCDITEVIRMNKDNDMCLGTNYAQTFQNCTNLKKILNKVSMQYAANNVTAMFNGCNSLVEVRLLSLLQNITFPNSTHISNASILHMIEKEAATSAIVITLHADAYARAMADADIQAALTAHPNVSLAK